MPPQTPTSFAKAEASRPGLQLRRANGECQSGWVVAEHNAHGAFLVRADKSAAPEMPAGETVSLSWQKSDGAARQELKAVVAYSSPSGLRLTLSAPLPELAELAASPAGPEHGAGNREPAALAAAMVELIQTHLGPGLGLLIEQADRQLSEAAGRTAMVEAGLSPKAAHAFLTQTSATLKPAFLDDLCAPWRQATDPAQLPAPELGTLELVEDEELELWLLRSESATHLEQALRPLLTELRPRLLSLAERFPAVSAEALLPEQILNALVRAGKRIDLPFPLRNLLVHLGRDPALLRLGSFYGALLSLLRNADIGPTRPAQRAAATTQAAPEAAPPRSEQGLLRAAKPGGTPVIPSGQAMATVHQLFSLSGRPQAEVAKAAPVSDEKLAQALSRLLEEGPVGGEADFEQSLRRQAATLVGESQIALNPRQAESLALLSQLHLTLTEDPLLPGQFRDWILRLLPALLRTQLSGTDPGERADGIRNLFGLLEFAAVLGAERRDPATRQLSQRVEGLLEPLVDQPTLGTEQLQQTCEALEQLLQRHRKAGAAVENRVVESCEGQQRLEDARRATEKEIGLAFAGRRVPVVLAELVDEIVRPNLVLANLRADDASWLAQLDALQALAEAARRARHGDTQLPREELREQVRAGWAELAAASGREDALLEATIDALAKPGGTWIAYHAPGQANADGDAGVAAAPTAGTTAAVLNLVKPGDWFGFASSGGEPQLLKLAWLSADRNRFVFVNQLGHKAEDLSAERLMELLDGGAARLLDERDATTIERAWRRMLEGLHNELAQQATHDALTGLLNRTEFERRLLAALSDNRRESLALLWIGVDHLSMINQSLGRAAGDAALQAVAQNLQRFISQRGAQAARIAGDEFVLLLPQVAEDNGSGVARTICREVAERQLQWKGSPYHLSVSIGIVASGTEPASPESLLQDAERAYKLAREDGGGKFYQHSDDDERVAKLRQTASWVGRVEQALASRQMLLYAQPAMSLSESACAGASYVEVLLRMEIDGAIYTPEQFLLAAERYGQIAAIDRFVSAELLHQLEGVGANRAVRFAFNLSARNLVDQDFVGELVARLRQQRFPLRRLCVELTETAAVAHLSEARRGMSRLAELGVALVLDDFGSGYASYQYLKHLPVDVVKVDGAFIRDITRAPENLALARSINEIAHLLGKQTVAEHVEDEETLALVREIGFDYAQGYHICRPQPLTQYLSSLR